MKNKPNPIYIELIPGLFILLCLIFATIVMFIQMFIDILETCVYIYTFLYNIIPVIRARIIILKNHLRYTVYRLFS